MIKTNNLQLLPCERIHVEAFLRGKHELAEMLHVTIPDSWPQFPEAFSLSNDTESSEPLEPPTGWGNYLFVHPSKAMLVGSGGFTGEPDDSGTTEVGYEIAVEFWNQGFATEAVQGLLGYAFAHEQVNSVIAHTLAHKNASNSVLQKMGMRFVAELDDPEEGKIWRWQVSREGYQAR